MPMTISTGCPSFMTKHDLQLKGCVQKCTLPHELILMMSKLSNVTEWFKI